jgi:hypothetical protein
VKKLLLTVYIILVVTASLAARADFVPPVKIKTAIFEYDSQDNVLRMSVLYPNSCVRQARAVLVPTIEENVLLVEVNASRFGDGCVGMGNIMNKEFEVTDIDAGDLKLELQRLHKNVNGVYTIMTRDGSFRQTIDFSTFEINTNP